MLMFATGGSAGRASVTKGEFEGTMESWTLRDSRKEQVVSIAALVDVPHTEKSDGGSQGPEYDRNLKGTKYLASPYEILAVVTNLG